jgi:hypothetical protein
MADALYFKVILHPFRIPPSPTKDVSPSISNEEKTVFSESPKTRHHHSKTHEKTSHPKPKNPITPHQTPESNRTQDPNKHRSHADHMAPKNPRVTFYDEIA